MVVVIDKFDLHFHLRPYPRFKLLAIGGFNLRPRFVQNLSALAKDKDGFARTAHRVAGWDTEMFRQVILLVEPYLDSL
jgi:hypothetical protein